jgi:hypothetical protein
MLKKLPKNLVDYKYEQDLEKCNEPQNWRRQEEKAKKKSFIKRKSLFNYFFHKWQPVGHPHLLPSNWLTGCDSKVSKSFWSDLTKKRRNEERKKWCFAIESTGSKRRRKKARRKNEYLLQYLYDSLIPKISNFHLFPSSPFPKELGLTRN